MKDPHVTAAALRPFIQAALAEDVGVGDATTLAVVGADDWARGVFAARVDCVVAGLSIAALVFEELDAKVSLRPVVEDGQRVAAGTALAIVEGPARAVLTGERTALNLMQRLSGIATLTAAYVTALGDERIAILDTRKTLPTMRGMEKYAVRCGGGQNHRFGLFDKIMIKDNHLAIAGMTGEGAIGRAVAGCRKAYPELEIEVEADNLEQVEEALRAEADWILLDNMGRGMVDEAARLRKALHRTTRLEVSGGISLATIGRYRGADVDAISVGALTHSATAIDVGLDFAGDEPGDYPDTV